MSEGIIRLSFFVGFLIIFSFLEALFPRRKLYCSKSQRWFNNLSLVIINTVVVRVLFPTAAVGIAMWVSYNQIGLLNYFYIPIWLKVLLAFIALDFAIYFQHVIFHLNPTLWRLHKVHHVDLDIDVTTGLRFHTIEIVLSMLIKMFVVILIGAPALAVIIFEIVLSSAALFNHSNTFIPLRIDKWLRYFVVTPDMHRVHHSTVVEETNSNYGFNLSVWDKMFGTYIDQPKLGHADMNIGLNNYRDSNITQKIKSLLLMPFKK